MNRISFSPSIKKLVPFMVLPWLFILIKPDSIMFWVSAAAWTVILGFFIYQYKQYATLDIDGNIVLINNESANQIQLKKSDLLFLSKSNIMISGKNVCNLTYKDIDGSEKVIKFLIQDEQAFNLLNALITK